MTVTQSYAAGRLHTAVNGRKTQPDGEIYYTGGESAFRLAGEIVTERDQTRNGIRFVGGTLRAQPLHRNGTWLGVYDLQQDLEIEIRGGFLEAVGENAQAGGFLFTCFRQAGAPDREVHFFFAPYLARGLSNGFVDEDLLEFTLCGNNTFEPSGRPVQDPALRVGLDLHVCARLDQQAAA